MKLTIHQLIRKKRAIVVKIEIQGQSEEVLLSSGETFMISKLKGELAETTDIYRQSGRFTN